MGIADTYMSDSVTITPKGTLGGDGKYTYDGTTVSTVARVKDHVGARLRNTGKEWVYQLKVSMRSTETIALQDKITYNSKTFIVKDIDSVDDIEGALDHYVVYCG